MTIQERLTQAEKDLQAYGQEIENLERQIVMLQNRRQTLIASMNQTLGAVTMLKQIHAEEESW